MRIDPPFRADHVGSLLRPRELKDAFRGVHGGSLGADEFRAIQDRAIRDVVALQEAIGLKSITDGEFRRSSYWAHFVEAVEGFEVRDSLFRFRDDRETLAFTAPHVVGRLRRRRSISGDEFRFLRDVTRETPKITLPSPSTMHFWRGPEGIEPGVYRDRDELFDDLARIYREEIAELAGLGATYVQLDEVPLAMLCDPAVRDAVEARGDDPEGLVALYVEAINAALASRPVSVTVALHLCRGNYKGKWISAGGYAPVAERLFRDARVDAFFLEYDSARAGDFEPLRSVPEPKVVVLGLVSSKQAEIESKAGLIWRIREAGRVLPLERLALSPQCGFASTVAGNPVTEEVERAKLACIVETAAEVWGSTG